MESMMVINRKLKITLAAMIAASQIGGSASVAAPTVDQLRTLQTHLLQGNLVAMVSFIDDNPEGRVAKAVEILWRRAPSI
jgi:hypothetical protein